MENNNKKRAENLKARLKCAQADIFSALKRYVNIFSFDKNLKSIINEPYVLVDETKHTLGLDGKRVYGVIVDFDAIKRNGIVNKAKFQINCFAVDTDTKALDMLSLIEGYEAAERAIKSVHLVPALEHRLNELHALLQGAIIREVQFKPKCFN